MRLLRDLSIAWKLALSSVASLALLGALVLSVLGAMATQRTLDQQVMAANAGQDSLHGAQVAVGGMRLSSREMQFQQTAATVSDASDAAGNLARRAADMLADVIDATPNPVLREEVERARTNLDTYRAAVSHAAELRAAMVDERDNGFLSLQSRFDSAVQSVRRDMLNETLGPADRDEAQEHLRAYEAAVAAMRDATMRFLATGDTAMQERVDSMDEAASSSLAAFLATPVSEDMKAGAADMAGAGRKIRDSARRLFEDARSLSDSISAVVDPAGLALDANLRAALDDFADLVTASRAQATAGQVQSRLRLLVLGAGAALLVIGSGIAVSRSVGWPVVLMTASVARMAAGDASGTVGFAGRRDEIGQMAAALEVLRTAVQRSFVQAQMIEQLPVGVMTADATGDVRITYLNAETLAVLSPVQANLPVPADQLLGQSIDVFFPEPDRQRSFQESERERSLLRDPANLPHRARVRVGEATFELAISALRGTNGGYLGPMVTWRVMTQLVRLSDTFEHSVGRIATGVGQSAETMREVAVGMSASAGQSGSLLEAVAQASQTATANVHAVAASAEELASSVQEIARQVAESAQMAGVAVGEAAATNDCVAGLSEAATRIGTVVRLIGDIAARTNLLALNATIEAARAGESGRGFAVVAGEVKTLATQTARATEEISAQITGMQGATAQVVAALQSIAATIRRMNEIAAGIAGAVEQQGAATREIARAVQQAAAGTAEVDSNLAEVSQAALLSGTKAREVVGAAEALTAQSGRLAEDVTAFLTAMQVAA